MPLFFCKADYPSVTPFIMLLLFIWAYFLYLPNLSEFQFKHIFTLFSAAASFNSCWKSHKCLFLNAKIHMFLWEKNLTSVPSHFFSKLFLLIPLSILRSFSQPREIQVTLLCVVLWATMMAASCVVEDITGSTSPTLTRAILIRTPKWVLSHLHMHMRNLSLRREGQFQGYRVSKCCVWL